MNVLQGALMGLIQGLGEFLPVSSSGHLLLARFFLGLEGTTPEAQSAFKVLDILLHVGTLIPLLIVFRKEWFDMILHPVKNKTFFLLVLASVPTLVISGCEDPFPGCGRIRCIQQRLVPWGFVSYHSAVSVDL